MINKSMEYWKQYNFQCRFLCLESLDEKKKQNKIN